MLFRTEIPRMIRIPFILRRRRTGGSRSSLDLHKVLVRCREFRAVVLQSQVPFSAELIVRKLVNSLSSFLFRLYLERSFLKQKIWAKLHLQSVLSRSLLGVQPLLI